MGEIFRVEVSLRGREERKFWRAASLLEMLSVPQVSAVRNVLEPENASC